jgi:bacterioferritin
MEHERASLDLYRRLLTMVEGHSVMIEEYARGKVLEEETHLGEVDKMLRKPGDIETFAQRS